jgi:hypothetical protein
VWVTDPGSPVGLLKETPLWACSSGKFLVSRAGEVYDAGRRSKSEIPVYLASKLRWKSGLTQPITAAGAD